MALHLLTTGDSHYFVGETFRIAACASVKTSKIFVKSRLIAVIPLRLKWPACEELVNIKLRFVFIHNIAQCYGTIDCTHILFDKARDTNGVDWFDRDHDYSMILQQW